MATKNLSEYDPSTVPEDYDLQIGIVVSDWNYEITSALLEGAVNTLEKHGVDPDNIEIIHVPGSFELVHGAKLMSKYIDHLDAIIVLGCIIRGETPHFDYISQGVTTGIAKLNADTDIPVIFGVLTTDTLEQAQARAGGSLGNKGDEAAITAIKMGVLRIEVIDEWDMSFVPNGFLDDEEEDDDEWDDDQEDDDDDEFEDENEDEEETEESKKE